MLSQPKAFNGTGAYKNRAANQTDQPDQGAYIFEDFKHFSQACGFNWRIIG
jgi:hypothetical protein